MARRGMLLLLAGAELVELAQVATTEPFSVTMFDCSHHSLMLHTELAAKLAGGSCRA